MSVSDDEEDFRPIVEDRRLTNLDERLGRLEASEAARTGRGKPIESDANYRMGNRVLADLIGGIAGGALIGWVVDRIFGTSPWGFMILFFMGIIVAFRNIFKLAGTTAQSEASAASNDRETG